MGWLVPFPRLNLLPAYTQHTARLTGPWKDQGRREMYMGVPRVRASCLVDVASYLSTRCRGVEAKVESLNPSQLIIKIPLVRKAKGDHLIKIHFPSKCRSPGSGFW